MTSRTRLRRRKFEDQAHTSHFTRNTCIAHTQKKMQLENEIN